MTGAAGLGFGDGGARCGAATQPESVSTPAMPVKKADRRNVRREYGITISQSNGIRVAARNLRPQGRDIADRCLLSS